MIHSFIHSLIKSSFSSKPSKYHYTPTVRARELNFERMLTPHNVSQVICQVSGVTVSGVMCHVSGITHHVSCVRCHVSGVTHFSFFLFWTKWWLCYQRGLSRLVFSSNSWIHLPLALHDYRLVLIGALNCPAHTYYIIQLRDIIWTKCKNIYLFSILVDFRQISCYPCKFEGIHSIWSTGLGLFYKHLCH